MTFCCSFAFQNGLVSPRAGSEGPAGTHGGNGGGGVVGGGSNGGGGAGGVPAGGAVAAENSTSTGSLKKKSVSSQSVNGGLCYTDQVYNWWKKRDRAREANVHTPCFSLRVILFLL